MDVLVVDDETIILRLLTRFISEQGHNVVPFSDAEEAWDAFQKGSYRLLVLDWLMPGMTGLDLCRKVRASREGPYCVIIIVTAMTKPHHLEEVLEAGADDYLKKPLDPDLLNVRLTIAERKVNDLALQKETQERLRLLDAAIRSSSDGILITTADLDTEGPRIEFANEGMAQMTGYNVRELRGQSLEIFRGAKTNQDVIRDMRDSLEHGKPFSTEIVHYKKDGAPYLVRWGISPVKDDSGTITHFVSVQREITEQRRLERELVEISEREQRRIGRDLHDGLGQKLTGLSFMAKSLERRLKSYDFEAAEQAMTIAQLVNEAKSDARTLSKGLVTVDLKGNGLVLALEELAARIEHFAPIKCTVTSNLTIPILDEDVATHLYRIGQEAMNNAFKHSGAKNIAVELHQFDNQIVLTVEDDGVGFPESNVSTPGMGLRIMEFRAKMINASFGIKPLPDGGTRVQCTLVNPGLLAQN